jgi:hypothetical protein
MKKWIIAVAAVVIGLAGALRAGPAKPAKLAADDCCEGSACCTGGPCCDK